MASTIWRGFITFGLISIPVRLFRAARAEKVSLRRLHRGAATPAQDELQNNTDREQDEVTAAKPTQVSRLTLVPKKGEAVAVEPSAALIPVKQVAVQAGSAKIIPTQALVKGFEYEKDKYVELETEQLRSAAIETSRDMPIEEFVKLEDIDPIYFETSYYLTPDGPGEKAYALLFQSMKVTGLVALARLSMHGREHVVVVRPGHSGMLAHTMFFSNEVRADEEYRADITSVNEKEFTLAQSLIHSLATPFEPEKYHDTYRQRLEALIQAKMQGIPQTPEEPKSVRSAVPDLTEALQRSLAGLKKPAAREPSPTENLVQAVGEKGKAKSRPTQAHKTKA